MRAGGFDRKITIQRRSVTRDATGSSIETWATLATVWATKTDKSGKEYVASGQEIGETVTQFTIRYRSDVRMQDRIILDGLTYDINGIAEITRRKATVLMAHAVQA